MKSLLRILGVSALLLVPFTAAQAQTPSVSAIADVTVNAGVNRTINVVAVGTGAITVSASLPAFATLNAPTTGTGVVSTTITLAPMAANTGTYNASVTATSGALSATETFLITVNAAGSNQAPVVVAPAVQNATVGTNVTFSVTATDSEAISTFAATGLPTGASFTPNGTNTAGTFSWTPGAGQVGEYDVVFTASNSLTGAATTHIHVQNRPPTLSAPATQTVTEGNTVAFTVTASDLDGDHVTLTTGVLPSGASATDQGNNTLNFSWQPTTTQSGTYTITFNGNDGNGGTVSTTTVITVQDSGGGNVAPVLTAPATRTVIEGNTVAFTVTATDANGDHVTLTTGALPPGATATDQGNNTLNFSWQPDLTQAGTYTITFNGSDGNGGTGTATTVITVQNSGGGGGTPEATVVLIGKVNEHNGRTCLRIKPVNNTFDVRNVTLSSITLDFNGQTITPLSGRTTLQFDCEGDDGHDGDDDGDHDGDCDNDAARLQLGGGHPRGDGHGDNEGDDEDCDCDNDNDGDGDGGATDSTCDAVAIKACFSTDAVIALFGDVDLPGGLADATVHLTLSDGTVIVATFDDSHLAKHENNGKKGLNPHARPNPLNPRTVLSFTLSRAGRVQVAVYDAQGRLVNTLLDENRAAGPQSLVWDGSNAQSRRVSSGVYFFRIQAAEGKVVQRVAVVK
jgi:plastocyanin